MLQATLQKLAANSGDKKDSIQFRIDEGEVEQSGDVILGMRRYDHVSVRFQARQSSIGEDGKLGFATVRFQSVATSLSMCVTETGIIATVTFSIEDPKVFAEVIRLNLRNQLVDLSFEEGTSPYKT